MKVSKSSQEGDSGYAKIEGFIDGEKWWIYKLVYPDNG